MNKSNVTVIASTPISKVPKESFEEYKRWVLDEGLSPSAALHKYMDKYNCPNPNASITIRLIEFTYPQIDISRNNFTFKIQDSGYPFVQEQMKDADFDNLIQEMLTLPSGW